MGEIKQANFRIDSDTAEKFRAFCEEQGYNQAQGFDHIIQILEVQRAKAGIEGRLTEITQFELHVKNIMDDYLMSLQVAEQTEDRVREDYKNDIKLRDKALAENAEKIESKQYRIEFLEGELEREREAAETQRKEAENAAEKMAAAEQLANEKEKINAMLTAKLAEAEEKLSGYDQLKINAESAQKTILELNHQIELLTVEKSNLSDKFEAVIETLNKSEEKYNEVKAVNAQLSLEKAEIQRDLREIEKLNAQKIEDLNKQHEQNVILQVERAVAKANEEKIKLQFLLDQYQAREKKEQKANEKRKD